MQFEALMVSFLLFRSSAATIDTTSFLHAVGPIGGAGGAYLFAQTFLAPSDPVSESVTMFLRDDYAADVPVGFRRYGLSATVFCSALTTNVSSGRLQ